MKNAILVSVALGVFLSACAVFPLRKTRIVWPDEVAYLEAMCEVDISWNGASYSGSMSLVMDYPSRLHMEVYGPFGDTLLVLKKDGDDFLLATKEERITDPGLFENRFGITMGDFIDDLFAIPGKGAAGNGDTAVEKKTYRVVYTLKSGKTAVCWELREGSICIRFLDVRFEGEDVHEESRDGSVS